MGVLQPPPAVLQPELQVLKLLWAVIDPDYEMELLRAAKASFGIDCL